MIRNEQKLTGVHPALVKVVQLAAVKMPVGMSITVLEGLRSLAKQKLYITAGASKLKDPLRGRHLTGHAVDLGVMIDFDADGDLDLRWDWPLYYKLADAMKAAAKELSIPIEWGGDWKEFKDGPHFQLPWDKYPKEN